MGKRDVIKSVDDFYVSRLSRLVVSFFLTKHCKHPLLHPFPESDGEGCWVEPGWLGKFGCSMKKTPWQWAKRHLIGGGALESVRGKADV